MRHGQVLVAPGSCSEAHGTCNPLGKCTCKPDLIRPTLLKESISGLEVLTKQFMCTPGLQVLGLVVSASAEDFVSRRL